MCKVTLLIIFSCSPYFLIALKIDITWSIGYFSLLFNTVFFFS